MTPLPRRKRAPEVLAPALARTSASLLIFPSRATRNGTPRHLQMIGSVVVVVVELVVVLCLVEGVVLVVVVIGGPQPWTRKSTSSRWSVFEFPVMMRTRYVPPPGI